jgi:lipid A disaccharide synthetase
LAFDKNAKYIPVNIFVENGIMPEWADKNIEEHLIEALYEYEEHHAKERKDNKTFANVKNSFC